MLRAALLALLCLAGCRKPTTRVCCELPDGLVAVVEDGDQLSVLTGPGDEWSEYARIPRTARALRFAPGGMPFAWMEDGFQGDKPVSRGFVWRSCSIPVRHLGRLRLEGLDDAPYTVSNDGVKLETRRQALPAGVLYQELNDQLDWLVLRHANERTVVSDVVEVFDHDRGRRIVLEAPIIVSAHWLDDEIVAIRRTTRKDVYENMLAHAPYEFGGEAIGGEAIRIRDGKIEPFPGLENRSVRALFRAR